MNFPDGQRRFVAHDAGVVGDHSQPRRATLPAKPKRDSLASVDGIPDGQRRSDTTQQCAAVGDQDQLGRAIVAPSPIPDPPALADPLLALLADALDDMERTRIAQENRLRQLTRKGEDKDGGVRGFGLDEGAPEVRRLVDVVAGLKQLENEASGALKQQLRRHPLAKWVKSQKGVGDQQAARLLAAVRDPYWNDLHGRPRTVSELWAFCGLVPGQKRRRGQRSNWSNAAKMRSWNIATSMLKAGNREVYDKRKFTTQDRLHVEPCVRCGPSGNPAQPGTPWSAGHRHADALRLMSKGLLKELWREAKALHTSPPTSRLSTPIDHSSVGNQTTRVGQEDVGVQDATADAGSSEGED